MPKMPATTVWASIAAQIVARKRPSPVAAKTMGRMPPCAAAGT